MCQLELKATMVSLWNEGLSIPCGHKKKTPGRNLVFLNHFLGGRYCRTDKGLQVAFTVIGAD
jgi:hypothetical protein